MVKQNKFQTKRFRIFIFIFMGAGHGLVFDKLYYWISVKDTMHWQTGKDGHLGKVPNHQLSTWATRGSKSTRSNSDSVKPVG